MTLLTALIFMAVIGLIVATVSAIIAQKEDVSQRLKIIDARNAVLTAALRNARTGTFYYSTLLSLSPSPPTTDPLYQCLIDDGATDCQADLVHPLTLIDSTDTSSPSVVVLDGAASPVHYDIYGQVCSTPSRNQCFFDIAAEFTPSCPNNVSPCKQASVIKVTVHVKVHSAYQSDYSYLNGLTASETVPISDFVHYYAPILPPVVPDGGSGGQYGAPIGYGAGPTGGITQTWLIEQGAPPPPPQSGPPPPPPPVPPAPNTCPSGYVMSNSGCVRFNF
jgi:type II secretory pathway pseudopilin PulG